MAKKKQIRVRLLIAVLLDGISYGGNTALLVDEAQAKSLVDQGLADDNAAAVEYALTQGRLVTHVVPEGVKPDSDSSADEPAADPVLDPPQT